MDITYGPEFRFIAPTRKAFHQLLPSHGPFTRLASRLMPIVPKFIIHALIKRLLVTWQHPENNLFDHGAILINACAERFCDERTSPEREIAVARQPGKYAYILLDQRLSQLFSAWPNFVSTAPDIAYAYIEDYLRLRPDVSCAASSIESLARLRKLPPVQLRTTVDNYNASLARSPLETTGGPRQPPLEGERWVLLGPLKSYFTTTEGGPRINQRLQVLGADGQPIPGLFAVGQNGLGGMVLWGHGLHIGWALTSGRLAGSILAKQAVADS
jgi:fumarate reductase flavoprotein subunit